jgi:hypothetical protein
MTPPILILRFLLQSQNLLRGMEYESSCLMTMRSVPRHSLEDEMNDVVELRKSACSARSLQVPGKGGSWRW